jgi:hypothetical protein
MVIVKTSSERSALVVAACGILFAIGPGAPILARAAGFILFVIGAMSWIGAAVPRSATRCDSELCVLKQSHHGPHGDINGRQWPNG